MKRPPRIARWLLHRSLPAHNRDDIIGDLEEEYAGYVVRERGPLRARWWYWRQALGSLSPTVGRDLGRDLRFGARALRQQPGFTVAAVLTLALGIGANTAIFSIVNAVLVRPLPYEQPGRLVHIWEFDRAESQRRQASYPEYLDWLAISRSFSDIAGYDGSSRTLTGVDGVERVAATQVTDNFFRTLGVTPYLGRAFQPGESGPDAAPVAMLTYASWQARFAGDEAIIGQTLTLNGVPFTVVGVLPPDFEFSLRGNAEFFLTLDVSAAEQEQRYRHWLDLIGRLRDGVTVDEAQAELSTLAGAAAADVGEWHAGVSELLVPLHAEMVRTVRPALLVLLVAVGVVLLVTCANVAGLLLARSASRARELSIRAALGAGRRRLLQQMLTESVLLAACGGAVGLLIGAWGLSFLVAALPLRQRLVLPHLQNLSLDGPMIALAVGLTLLTGLLVGSVPAWRAAGAHLRDALVGSGRSTTSGSRATLLGARPLLVVAEVTMAVVLAAGAGVLGKSMVRLMQVSPGFDPDGVLTMAVDLPDARYDTYAKAITVHRDLLERVSALPGVTGVGTINQLPFRGPGNSGTFTVEGAPLGTGEVEPEVNVRTVSTRYFDTLGVPLLAGRGFAPSDNRDAPTVLLVNETLAQRYFPERGPLGRRIAFSWFRDGQPLEIVGVVGDEHFAGPDQPVTPVAYFPYSQTPEGEFRLVVRSAVPPLSLGPSIRAAAAELDPAMPVYEVATMNEIAASDSAVALRRYVLLLVGAFAVLALLLAAVGLYGVMAQSVIERTREIGVRLVLGADSGEVVGMVVRQGMIPALAGLLVGLAMALAALRYLGGLLYEVQPYDPTVLAAVAVLLGAIALAACWLPARRAARVDPMVSLRAE
ncbi:MAG: ADOP family duplicated permease [Acidobacteriota bacterium]|jgi:putative ABC transport system permease protein